MIQEKDFLYRVPVKTAPITTPRGQIRNPEILVDLEGGEFMHGNILDANSTNKLINQSVKEAVDNKLVDTLNTAISTKQDKGDYVTYSSEDDNNYYFHKGFTSSVPFSVDDSDGNEVKYGINGITSSNHPNCLATSNGSFKPISDFASAEQMYALMDGLSAKQNKITANEVDATDIETADITKLRTIVTDLIDALNASGLIRRTKTLK